MKLIEIFNHLTYGELSQLNIGGSDVGEISEANYPRVVSHVNLGLTALYKRFPLKQNRVTIELVNGIFTYTLTAGDIHKVEAVYTEGGWELGLNDEADIHAISTPSATVLRVPPVIVLKALDLDPKLITSTLEVVYRANHPVINPELGTFDPYTYDIELPYSHLEPLLYYVASRVNNPIGMVNEFNAGNNYAAKYEQACQLLEVKNLNVDQGSQTDKLHKKGFV